MSLLKLPGLIDIHVHLRDPGQTQKEDFLTGTSAALAGGFTLVCDMPNNTQLANTAALVGEKISLAKQKIVSDIGFYLGTLGDKLPELEKSKPYVLGLKIYLNETTGGYFVRPGNLDSVFSAWHDDRPVLLHAEADVIDRVVAACRRTGQKIHICHVARKEELEAIIRAKQDGLPITCGVTPHHLFLTEADVKTLGPLGLMKPALATAADVAYLWDHLGMIDVVESDHAPHTLAEKQSDQPPFGVPGLETTLPLLLTAVSEKRLSVPDVIRLLHTGPRNILGLPVDVSTYIDVDADTPYTLENSTLKTKCGWTPFAGRKVRGKVISVTLRGTTVYDQGQVLAPPGSGNVVLR